VTQRQRRNLGIALGSVMIVALVLATTLASCVVSLGDGKRRVVAGELTRDVILPTYEDVVTSTTWLRTATHEFVDAPAQDTLDALRTAWRAARVPWKLTTAFRFGPLSVQTLGVAIDQTPVDPARIDGEIAGTAILDATYVGNLGANKKGFHSIEYLVFATDDTALLGLFTTDANAQRRRDFLAGIADDLALTAVKLRDAWVDEASRLADPGADNTDYPTITASIDALVNESVFQVENIADGRIGKPLGTATGGIVHPELQESGPSGLSIDDMENALESIRNIYFGSRDGTPGKGIGGLILDLSPSTDRDVKASLATAAAALAAIPRPFTQALLDGRPEVMTAYTAVLDVKHVFASEVIATLGATLKFNANDGD
jgi:putative iron-regulated protein